MSAKSLGELAEDRDVKQPGQSIGSATDVLVAAVPTEALAAYTTLIGIVLATNIGAAYSQFRWSAYGAFVALAISAPLVVYRHRVATSSKQKRIFPIEECLVAGLAAAAWGLVMPGSPLGIVLKGNALVFATTAIIVGAATVIGFATPVLGSANRKNPTDKATAPAARDAPAPHAKVTAPAAPAAPAAADGEVTTPAAADAEAPAPAAADAEAPAPAAPDAEAPAPAAPDAEASAPAAADGEAPARRRREPRLQPPPMVEPRLQPPPMLKPRPQSPMPQPSVHQPPTLRSRNQPPPPMPKPPPQPLPTCQPAML